MAVNETIGERAKRKAEEEEARKNGQGAKGKKDFRDQAKADEEEATADRRARLRARVKSPAEIRSMQAPPSLVDGWLSRGDSAIIYGAPKAAKSLAAQHLANARGTGREWLGLPTTPGRTLYVAAEGIGGLGKRNRAWEDYHGEGVSEWERVPAAIDGVYYLPGSVNLLDAAMVADLADLAADLAGVDLVILDTVARVMVGGDENAARDMNLLVRALDQIRETALSTTLGVHHSGKDEAKGMRGSSALLGAVDAVFHAQMANKVLTLEAECLRDLELPAPVQARLVPWSGSVVLEPIAFEEVDAPPHPALVTLREIDDPGGVATSVWEAACEMSRRTFYRARTKLVEAGLVVNVGSEKQPRYRATDEDDEP